MSDKYWNRCNACGKFISFEDFLSGKARHDLVEPSSLRGPEVWETLCAQHAPADRQGTPPSK